ncbi:MAG: CHAP domain-containing protein, partial [Streptococcus sp.]
MWTMYWRQCTSFAAYRLSNTNGFNLPVAMGIPLHGGSIARANGYRVDMNPAVGSIAGFRRCQRSWYMGHVAWVEVHGDQVTIEEYNYDAGQGPEKYHKRSFHKSQVSGYIHFKDLESGTQNRNPTNSSIKVGDSVRFTGTFRVTSVSGNTITSQDLAGGTPTKHNIVDPSPVLEVDAQDNPTSDQYLNPGETFTIPGNFKVLAIDPPSDGVLVQIGILKTWVTQS